MRIESRQLAYKIMRQQGKSKIHTLILHMTRCLSKISLGNLHSFIYNFSIMSISSNNQNIRDSSELPNPNPKHEECKILTTIESEEKKGFPNFKFEYTRFSDETNREEED